MNGVTVMKVIYIVNNYIVGAKLKTTPVDKLVKRTRLNAHHTELVYELDNMKEKEFCDKVLNKYGVAIINGNK